MPQCELDTHMVVTMKKIFSCKDIMALLLTPALLFSEAAMAAISLDRTRAIFPGNEKSIALNIGNVSEQKPYLAQAWLEDAEGRKIVSPLTVTPPLQRLEPLKKSVVRVNATEAVAALPMDRETLFYFNLREIPPRSEQPNVMQLALQSKIKLFYRPAAIIPEKYSRQDDKLVLYPGTGGYKVENPTPYYMTVLGITGEEGQAIPKSMKAVMIAPKSSEFIRSDIYPVPHLTTINDFGGKPVLGFPCQNGACRANVQKQ